MSMSGKGEEKVDLKEKFIEFIKKEELVERGQSILLGVSGGPDSLAMLDLFNRIKESFQLELVVFHLNHMFREEAEEEARFVERITSQYGLKSIVEKYNVPAFIQEKGLSPEQGARIIRFKLMEKALKKLNINKISLAHNKDDQVETVFLHMYRGAGLNGLTGINPLTEMDGFQVIHPLLDIYREDIERYCHHRNLKPRNDPTNEETIYTRNKIRHDIIPYIEKEINPGVKDVVIQMAGIIREENDFLDKLAANNLKNIVTGKKDREISLSLDHLRNFPLALRRRIIQQLIYSLDPDYSDFYFNHYQLLDRFIHQSETGKILDLPGELKVKRQYNHLIFRMGEFEKNSIEFNLELTLPGEIYLPGGRRLKAGYITPSSDWLDQVSDPEICVFDAGPATFPLKVRNRRPGDKFSPLGMTGIKKIKDFFIDEKIPAEDRDKIPLVIDHTGRIIWVAGLRLDNRFKITAETKKYVKLTLI